MGPDIGSANRSQPICDLQALAPRQRQPTQKAKRTRSLAPYLVLRAPSLKTLEMPMI